MANLYKGRTLFKANRLLKELLDHVIQVGIFLQDKVLQANEIASNDRNGITTP
ncbi:hypothetical protein NZD89_04485 [Alicyclobacillus fastidiosus]|uniref:Uncharacterized protein n=1 Tax=Alicyclobacillus fastidiosus TaxID=392011 RepID=A0ABY6ZIJ2_9BACL|nr:hypothetical protein [Alicyclobacillus fastidiosus]WAH42699.1 hypothetical protein NZD89_04485 [Alicyclobacillus fastidiosus]GMA64587.1 hypothetical protein GCM10025859_50270 [Alicyclobacillus fastidiosus]